MNKKKLDKKIILYSDNNVLNIFNILKDMQNKEYEGNIWQLAYTNNINNTSLVANSEVMYLDSLVGKIGKEKRKLKESINEFVYDYIIDYLEEVETSSSFVKPWTICKGLNSSNFYSDEDKTPLKHNYTIIVFLNDEYAGGNFKFKNRVGNDLISFKSGDVLIYPSGKDHLHTVTPVTDGVQYLAVSYF